jgi:hypothetical protein
MIKKIVILYVKINVYVKVIAITDRRQHFAVNRANRPKAGAGTFMNPVQPAVGMGS